MSDASTARSSVAVLAAIVLVAGCGVFGGRDVDRNPVPGAWTAEITPQESAGPSGFATVSLTGTGSTRANLTLSGGLEGAVHPWFIHEGGCDEPGSVVGRQEAYPELRPNPRGNASATATLDAALDPEGDYAIVVHRSSEEMEVILGCGELRSTS